MHVRWRSFFRLFSTVKGWVHVLHIVHFLRRIRLVHRNRWRYSIAWIRHSHRWLLIHTWVRRNISKPRDRLYLFVRRVVLVLSGRVNFFKVRFVCWIKVSFLIPSVTITWKHFFCMAQVSVLENDFFIQKQCDFDSLVSQKISSFVQLNFGSNSIFNVIVCEQEVWTGLVVSIFSHVRIHDRAKFLAYAFHQIEIDGCRSHRREAQEQHWSKWTLTIVFVMVTNNIGSTGRVWKKNSKSWRVSEHHVDSFGSFVG